jgi:catechol 2,3-dioxygenase-like lactoylglutathione lyase family enzyme
VTSLGRFLEIGIATADPVDALQFYEALGFAQASVGEAWQHPYAVVTDGRLSLGLHATELEGLLPTWVSPDVRHHVDEFTALGIAVEHLRLDELSLNEAWLRDPVSGLALRVLEARTFSPPPLEPGYESRLGYFEELALPVEDFATAVRFWDSVGFVAFEPDASNPARVVIASRDLNVALYAGRLPGPVLCFTATDMPQRVEALRQQGLPFARQVPHVLGGNAVALLHAPDGVNIVLSTTSDEA